MRSRPVGVSVLISLLLLLGCDTLGEGEFVGVIANASSHTLFVDDPLDDTKEFRLKPGEQTKRYALDEGWHTFSAYYASDRTLYVSESVNINGVKDDAYFDGLTRDWAVVFCRSVFLQLVDEVSTVTLCPKSSCQKRPHQHSWWVDFLSPQSCVYYIFVS